MYASRTKFPAKMFARVLLLLVCVVVASSFDSRNVAFVIVSQDDHYHRSVAQKLEQDLKKQVLKLEKRAPRVVMTHEELPILGAWTIIPMLQPLLAMHKGTDVRWFVFLEPHTVVRCSILLQVLEEADGQQEKMWIGYPLSDESPTIIHHYETKFDLEDHGGLWYPMFASGFAMKTELAAKIPKESTYYRETGAFSIDPSFELALAVYREVRVGPHDSAGPLLTPDLRFCVVPGENCATYPKPYHLCGNAVPEESILFAVKTWSGFHQKRVPVLKKTWGRHVSNLLFFSDVADPSIPTIDIGVPNTARGHCKKTIAILKYAVDWVKQNKHIQWIFIADDDTILGVHRVCEVLSCFRGGSSPTVLGERYGYRLNYGDWPGDKYDYLTGGGGIVVSVGAAAILSRCGCPAADAPDDMALGVCARDEGLSFTHLPHFHQNNPNSYAREILAWDRPVSFHRHSSPDPVRVYATWFQQHDLALNRRRTRDDL